MRRTLITSDRPLNGFTLSTTMVRGPLGFRNATLTRPFPLEHYFDREAESNNPSFLTQSLNTLWNPQAPGIKVA